MTMTVATTGTMTFRSTQCGRPGNRGSPSSEDGSRPTGGASVSAMSHSCVPLGNCPLALLRPLRSTQMTTTAMAMTATAATTGTIRLTLVRKYMTESPKAESPPLPPPPLSGISRAGASVPASSVAG